MEELNKKHLEKLVGCEWEERENESKLRQSFLLGLVWSSSWELIVLAKQLWPFCVTEGFPQALTSGYRLRSPFLHLKGYLENIN